ncbi:MAG: DUF86 domain-containing protein [candidate division KSB1 bacterium]|nr:DUF86 domain-containing protein [candidate division KSB1 bacterium]
MLEQDVILSKISIIKNCLNTIQKATQLDPDKLNDIMVQDVFVLNLQRAIQAAIDMANVVISQRGLKLPASYRECFMILRDNQVIDAELCEKMVKMTGFRNIAVHDYQQINVVILKEILKNHLIDLETFYSLIYELDQDSD